MFKLLKVKDTDSGDGEHFVFQGYPAYRYNSLLSARSKDGLNIQLAKIDDESKSESTKVVESGI